MERINTEQIPESQGNMLAALLLKSITEYYSDSKHQQEFEEWKKNRENNKANS